MEGTFEMGRLHLVNPSANGGRERSSTYCSLTACLACKDRKGPDWPRPLFTPFGRPFSTFLLTISASVNWIQIFPPNSMNVPWNVKPLREITTSHPNEIVNASQEHNPLLPRGYSHQRLSEQRHLVVKIGPTRDHQTDFCYCHSNNFKTYLWENFILIGTNFF